MISAKTNKGETSLEISGSFLEIMADTVTIVDELYKSINEQDEYAGKLFKKFIEDNKLNDMIFHMDEEELKMDRKMEELKKNREELKNAAIELIEGLFS